MKKSLSEAEAGFCEAATMGKTRVEMGSAKQYADVDTRAGRVELVVQSLVSWNLDEEDGVTLWPLDAGLPAGRVIRPGENPYPPGCPRRRSVARLPSPVFDLIWEKCNELNEPRKGAEAAQFREGAGVGGPDGDGGAA